MAGVAQAFALNPLLGVGAAALAAGVLSAANALANKYDTDTSNLGTSGLGNYQMSTGTVLGSSGGTGGTSGGVGGLTGGLTTTSSRSTGTSTTAAKQTLIEQVTAENFIKNMPAGNFNPSMARRADEVGNVTINVNAPSVIDREGFSRAVVDALNESSYRNGGGGGQLVL